jgi:HAT1-interacting factor 1
MADLYFSYGKALLENAISQASVLGKEPEPGPQGEEEKRRVTHPPPPLYLTRTYPP